MVLNRQLQMVIYDLMLPVSCHLEDINTLLGNSSRHDCLSTVTAAGSSTVAAASQSLSQHFQGPELISKTSFADDISGSPPSHLLQSCES